MEKEKRRRAYEGLHMMRGKWRATIELPDTFESVEDAARCRQEAEKALMESIAKLSTKRAQQQSPAARRSKLRTAAGGLRTSAAKLNSVGAKKQARRPWTRQDQKMRRSRSSFRGESVERRKLREGLLRHAEGGRAPGRYGTLGRRAKSRYDVEKPMKIISPRTFLRDSLRPRTTAGPQKKYTAPLYSFAERKIAAMERTAARNGQREFETMNPTRAAETDFRNRITFEPTWTSLFATTIVKRKTDHLWQNAKQIDYGKNHGSSTSSTLHNF